MIKAIARTLGAMMAVSLVAGCSGEPAPVVTPAPPSEEAVATTSPSEPDPSVEPEAEPEPEAERGTRENPMAAGESRQLAPSSAWNVSAGPTEIHDGYVVVPLSIGIDWESIRAQAEAAGEDPDAPVNPVWSLTVKFVSASGQTFDQYDYDADIPNEWFGVGDLYPPLERITANFAVNVPTEHLDGGVWSVENAVGDRIFIAQT